MRKFRIAQGIVTNQTRPPAAKAPGPPTGIPVHPAPSADISQVYADAFRDHAGGRLIEAERRYRQILQTAPGHPDVLHLLGVLNYQVGHDDKAIDLIVKAVVHDSHVPAYYNTLGTALQRQGKLDDACMSFHRALMLMPDSADIHYNLGNAHRQCGRLDDAQAAYRRSLAYRHDWSEAHNNLGLALQDKGNLESAVSAYVRALICRPDHAAAHGNLGTARHVQGKPELAIASLGRALAIQADHAETHNNLGIALKNQGKLALAAVCFRLAVVYAPAYADAHYNAGNHLKSSGRLTEAVLSYRRAVSLAPYLASARNNLGDVLKDRGQLDEAIASFWRAVFSKPDYVEAHSNFLHCLNYGAGLSPEELYAAHRRWDAQHGAWYGPTVDAVGCKTRRDRSPRLRVGYVSADFRIHPVASFIEPLLRHHDPALVEVHCYSDVVQPDTVTTHLASLAEHWHSTVGMSDETLVRQIRRDGIDILVDLAGHTANNRLRVFAAKAAPVQVTWLGYPNTTGLSAMDYRLVDAMTDPPGRADACASETLLRLPDGFLCYAPPVSAPDPRPTPYTRQGFITFGSFNNPAKLSGQTLDVWANLLARAPGSRLLLKGPSFVDPGTRALFVARLTERGVSTERMTVLGPVADPAYHLALYADIDVALDPFPYNGTTTTFEALWMGVPVVTLLGDRHAGRVGASLLARVGLDDLIAENTGDYEAIAVRLAGDLARLIDLRAGLRNRMANSPLCDGPGFARRIETAYRTMWQTRFPDSDAVEA